MADIKGADTNKVDEPFRCAADHAIRFRDTIAARPQRPLHGYMQALEALREPVPEHGDEAIAVIDELVA